MIKSTAHRRFLPLLFFVAGIIALPTEVPTQGETSQMFELLPELSAQAVFSCQDLTIAGDSVVTSEGLGTGIEGDEGHVRSNANVRLKGSVEVHGDAVAGGEVILSG